MGGRMLKRMCKGILLLPLLSLHLHARAEDTCSGSEDETCVSDASKIARFEEWLQKHELPLNLLKIESIPGFRMGTTATENLKEGQLYISVPEKLLIGPERVGPGTKLHKKLSAIVNSSTPQEVARLLDDRTKLLMFVLREKHSTKGSFWKEYWDVMPATFSSPTFFSEDELKELQASELVPAARRERQKLRQEYDLLRAHVFSADRKTFPKRAFSLSEWRWASALYDSRVIQLNRNTGRGNTPTFSPLIDMVNCIESHDRSFIAFNFETRAAEMRADRDTPKGVQVFETYGNKSNYEYLLYNGFVMDDNPNDCLYLSFPNPKGDGREMSFCVGSAQALPKQVKYWARAMSDRDLRVAPTEHLLRRLREKLAQYPTSIEEDRQRLSEVQPLGNDNLVFAVKMRMHEKQTLRSTIAKLEDGTLACCD